MVESGRYLLFLFPIGEGEGRGEEKGLRINRTSEVFLSAIVERNLAEFLRDNTDDF